MTCGIYRFIFPSGKSYVGQSVNIKKRFSEHKRRCTSTKNKASRFNTKFYNAVRKYGFDSMQFEILELCERPLLSERERWWIKFLNSVDNGYNSTDGGDGGFVRAEATKKKLKEIFKGVYNGDQNIEFYIDGTLYTSIGSAATILGIARKTIHNCLNSNNIKYSEYRYKDESKMPVRRNPLSFKPIEIDGKIFNSIAEAVLNGHCRQTLERALAGKSTRRYKNINVRYI